MNPVVSIGILTYNHEKYIADAIEGILKQKGDFSLEIIIADDYSTDKTPDIIHEYQKKYSDIIQLLPKTWKKGQAEAAKSIYQQCKGKYLAWLDGDDYWTYEYKLREQIDFLEKNIEYVGCFHDAAIVSIYEEDVEFIYNQSKTSYRFYSQLHHYPKDLLPNHLLTRCLLPTSSLVFRNSGYISELSLFKGVRFSLNWLIFLIIIKNSKFRFINETWSVYREHPAGITKTTDYFVFAASNIQIYKRLLKDNYYKKFSTEIYHMIANEYRHMIYDMKLKNISWKKRFQMSVRYLRFSIFATLNDFTYIISSKK